MVNIGLDRGNGENDVVSIKQECRIRPSYQLTEKGKTEDRDEYPERRSFLHHVRSCCRRTRTGFDETNLADTAELMRQYMPKIKAPLHIQDMYDYIKQAVVMGGYTLNSKGVHVILKKKLGLG